MIAQAHPVRGAGACTALPPVEVFGACWPLRPISSCYFSFCFYACRSSPNSPETQSAAPYTVETPLVRSLVAAVCPVLFLSH